MSSGSCDHISTQRLTEVGVCCLVGSSLGHFGLLGVSLGHFAERGREARTVPEDMGTRLGKGEGRGQFDFVCVSLLDLMFV